MINIYHPTPEFRRVTSPYGPRNSGFHNGMDTAARHNSTCLSASRGEVVRTAFDKNGYGNYIIIQHKGFCTLYAHLNGFLVGAGDVVDYRQPIALIGNTGVSTGPHLHFEVREGVYDSNFFSKANNGRFLNSIDPQPLLASEWKEISMIELVEEGLISDLSHGVLDKWDNGTLATILLRGFRNLGVGLKIK